MAIRRSLSLEIPYPALSTNMMYSGRKVRSYYYKRFRKDIFKFLSVSYPDPVSLKGNLVLSMEVGFSSPLSDLSNAIKSTEDVLAEYFSFNDRMIVSIKMNKYLVNKGSEYMIIKINKTNKNIDRRVKYVKGKR